MVTTTINKLLLFCFTFSFIVSCQTDFSQKMDKSVFSYPTTTKLDAFDMFHGEKVPDPYKWLEDDRSKETVAWVKSQNDLSGDYMSYLPQRKAIHNRLKSLWAYERYQNPTKVGEYYYYLKNDGLQNQDVLYKQKGLEGEPIVLLDPNTFSADGTASLGAINFSPNGKYLAYQKSVGGSDWHEVNVLDLETGKKLTDKIEWVKFSQVSWTDNGFYHSRYPAPKKGQEKTSLAQNQTVYFHKIGTESSDDETVYFDRANPIRGFNIFTSEDDSIQVLQSWESTSGNALSIRTNKDHGFAPIIESFDHDYEYIGHLNKDLYFLTNGGALNKKIVKINTANIENPIWETVINEAEDAISSASIYGNNLVLNYIHNAASKIRIFNTEGKLIHEVKLPGIGTVQSMSGTKKEKQAFFSFASYTQPTSIYTLNIETGQISPYKIPKINFDSDKYVTKQEIFTSKDGTKIPMFISHKKGLKMDGQRPTMLYGYGGFNISILPSFNTSRLSMAPVMMENDGIFAVANIRGGGADISSLLAVSSADVVSSTRDTTSL